MSVKLIIYHSYGLGDAVMAYKAINLIKKYSEDNDLNLCLIASESSALNFFKLKGIDCLKGGNFFFLKELILSSFKEKVISLRTSENNWKDNLLSKFLNLFGILFLSKRSFKTSVNLVNYREWLNLEIAKNLINVCEKKNNFNSNLKFIEDVCVDKKNFSILTHLGLPDLQKLKNEDNPRKVFFHFGSGDKLNKSLRENVKKEIMDHYQLAFEKSEFFFIRGPRDSSNLLSVSKEVKIIQNKSIKELSSICNDNDIILCNDTGIGHLFSHFGVKVTMVVKRTAKYRILSVLPSNINKIILI